MRTFRKTVMAIFILIISAGLIASPVWAAGTQGSTVRQGSSQGSDHAAGSIDMTRPATTDEHSNTNGNQQAGQGQKPTTSAALQQNVKDTKGSADNGNQKSDTNKQSGSGKDQGSGNANTANSGNHQSGQSGQSGSGNPGHSNDNGSGAGQSGKNDDHNNGNQNNGNHNSGNNDNADHGNGTQNDGKNDDHGNPSGHGDENDHSHGFNITHWNQTVDGRIFVNSTPKGATISLDGVAKDTTPSVLKGIAAGTHQITLSLTGYQDFTQSVSVTNHHTSRVNATLVPAVSGSGTIVVNSTPVGANVTVDGMLTGTTPVTFTGVSLGDHIITVSLTGYQDFSQTITVAASQAAPLEAVLVPSETAPTTGTVDITSTPAGAALSFDGVASGTTPATLTDIAAGDHTVVLTLTGYQDLNQTVTVIAGQTSTIDVPLVPVAVDPTTGSISVTSTPAGANVTLDGAAAGTTPEALSEIAAGDHQLVISLAGYEDFSQNVTVAAGQTSAIDAALVPVVIPPVTGTIAVTSAPAGANISLDGTAAGTTPANLTEISAGDHQLAISLSGYETFTQTVAVTAGQTSAIDAALVPVVVNPTTGSIALTSSPAGAAVSIDSVASGITPVTLSDVAAGDHVIVLTLSGYEDFNQTVAVAAGQTSAVDATLVPVVILPTTGTISLTSTPSGAQVALDGVASGTTPATLADIAPGDHTVVLTSTGYQDFTQTVTVTAGQTSTIDAALVPVVVIPPTGTLAITSLPIGASVVVDGFAQGPSPVTLSGFATGDHQVVLSLTGYQDYSQTVTVSDGQTSTVNAALVPVVVTQPKGSIDVSSTPAGATVKLDGADMGTTPVTLTGIATGSHQIILSLTGYEDFSQPVTVSDGMTSVVSGNLVPVTGIISVISTPAGASVKVDGVAQGVTPTTLPGIATGDHQIVISLAGYQDFTQTLTVTSGMTLTVNANLVPAVTPTPTPTPITSIALSGAISRSVTVSYIGMGVASGHYGSYTDSQGNLWEGMPLWYLAGMADDSVQHGAGAFNDTLAATGYTITVTGKDGSSATLDSQSVARNSGYIIATTENGAPIPAGSASAPLKLVGSSVPAGGSIDGVTSIKLNL